jgi:lipopolysaccharide biosynthesis glycosyltransferase
MNKKTALLFCVEKGNLEIQAQLLVNSISKFTGQSKLKLFAISPRVDSIPSFDTNHFFNKNKIFHIKENLNTEFLEYPIANKVLACEYVEKNFPEFDSILFVDTDTVFLNPIEEVLLSKKNKLYLRPVDNKGPGSIGIEDEKDGFWQEVFQMFNLPLPSANITTTVREKTIRPYFNAGFIWAHGLPGFYSQWKQDFIKIVDSGLRPFAYKSRDNTDFRCLDQVALAVTAQRFKENIEVLPQSYNYPIPFRPLMKDRKNHPSFNELIHVHYHKWFQHAGFLDHVTSAEDKLSEQYNWLKKQLPLMPEIFGDFKS